MSDQDFAISHLREALRALSLVHMQPYKQPIAQLA